MGSIQAANLFSVEGLVVVLTGGGSGIGAMLANALDANGAAKVFILGRREDSLKKVASEAVNKSIIPIVCDVSSKDSLAAAAATIASQTPFVNTVIANSGVAGRWDSPILKFGETVPTVAELQEHFWATSQADLVSPFEINVVGTFNTFLAFLNLLDAGNKHADSIGKAGYIQSQFITVGSIAGLSRDNIVGFSYSASKAATHHLTQMLATQFAPYGIRANSILPGVVSTEATESVIPSNTTVPGSLPAMVNVARRSATKEDLAGIILWLTSRAGGFVNGELAVVDGGGISIRP